MFNVSSHYFVLSYTSVYPCIVYHGGNPVKNAWRMNNATKDKWYIIFAKTPETKNEWMKAFEIERKRVTDDKEKGGQNLSYSNFLVT